MTLYERRAEFVRRVWGHLVPNEANGYELVLWVPEKLLTPLGHSVSRTDLGKIDLTDSNTCIVCFAKIHRSLNRNWSRLTPEFAGLVEQSLNELNLWEGFDLNKIRVSDDQRDVSKIRFDIADIVFASKRAILDRELQALSVVLDRMMITRDVKNNEAKIIKAVEKHLVMRAHIDLAILTIQNIRRGTSVIQRITSRLRVERERYYQFLRDLLKASSFYSTPDGNIYFADDKIMASYTIEIRNDIDRRLAEFTESLDRFEELLEREVPPREIVDECSEIMRKSVMPSQHVTTNIHVTNSQVGVLNTGTIQDVQSIDTSITTLKSQGDIDVGDAFKKITEGIMGDDTLGAAERAELLSNIKYLSEMAAKKKEDRNPSVVKSVLRSISDGVTAAGPVVKALLPLIPVLTQFFGLSILEV